MRRDEMNQMILTNPDADVRGEIEHYLGIEDREYNYDAVCALIDAEEAEGQSRTMVRKLRSMMIDIGYYRVMPQEEIENTFTSHGTPWVFKMDGVAYTSDRSSSEWFDDID